ncbi:hypothetical protein Tco_1029417 [Tanacetum coccineum]|uniref:Uncharacterized protein n=1 Tax=Tanacetum coccineum TaxID=301880 RepID=A0ABQ5G3L3_9ASTR
MKTWLPELRGISIGLEDLVPNSMWSQMIVKIRNFALLGNLTFGAKARQYLCIATSWESARESIQKDESLLSLSSKEGDFLRLGFQDIEVMLFLLVTKEKVDNLNVELSDEKNSTSQSLTRTDTISRRQSLYTILRSKRILLRDKDKKKQIVAH